MKPLLLILVLGVSVSAQSRQCPATAADAPPLRGFRLGMSIDEVKTRTDMWELSLTKPVDETGFTEGDFNGTQLLSREDQDNLLSVRLAFLDGRVVTIEVKYGGSIKWDNADDFTSTIAQGLNLPPSHAWQPQEIIGFGGIPVSGRILRCGDVGFAAVFQRSGSTLIMGRTDSRKIRDDRRAALQEKARQTFKP